LVENPPHRKLLPSRVKDVHQWIGAAILQGRQAGSNMYTEPHLYWEETPGTLMGIFTPMIMRSTYITNLDAISDLVTVGVRQGESDPQWVEIVMHPPGRVGSKPLPTTMDSREQKVVYGFAGQEGNQYEHKLVGGDRVIIAYPGNMFGLPMYTWVMQEYQSTTGFEEIGVLTHQFFESAKIWEAVIQLVQNQWTYLEQEKLELLMDDLYTGQLKQAMSFSLTDADIQGNEQLKQYEELSKSKEWIWTIVPHPILEFDGTVTIPVKDKTPITVGDFTALSVVASIGGMAQRWLRERPINWSLPYSLIPWTDPWE